MPASNSSGLNEWDEGMASLDNNEQVVDTAAVVRAAFLSRGCAHVSQRLDAILSNCQNDSEIDRGMWDDFEIHRRSADTYLNQYLDCWQQVHETRSGHIYEIDDSNHETPHMEVVSRARDTNATDWSREEWRLKILRDSLARDLLAMDETLEFLETRSSPPPSKDMFPISALLIPSVLLGYVLWLNSHPGKAISVFAASAAGSVRHKWPAICRWTRKQMIDCNQKKTQELLKLLNKGEVDEGNRATLRGMSFYLLDHFRE